MLGQIKNILSASSSVCSIELHVDSKGSLFFNWLVMSKKKQLLVVDKSGSFSDTFENFQLEVSNDIPLIFSVSGKGVLHKKVEQQGKSPDKLFDYVFPNARIEDYLVQSLLSADNSFFVSVIRKDQLDKLISVFSDRGYSVLSVSLGPFSILPFFSSLNYITEELDTGKHKLKIVNHSLLTYLYEASAKDLDVYLTIGDQNISSSQIVAYSNAFQYLVDLPGKIEVDYLVLKDAASTFEDKIQFKRLSWGGLFFFFFILLINAFFYTVTSSANNELTAQYNSVQQLSSSNKKDMEDFGNKEAFLQKSGWLNPAALSFYADRIAASLPEQIQLTNLILSPLNESLTRKSKKEIFDHDMIVIKGVASKPTDINQWTKQLSEFTWIDQVKVQDYSFDHKSMTGVFTLHIHVTDEME